MLPGVVSSNSRMQQMTTYFHLRNAELIKLGENLKDGDLSAAKRDFRKIETLAQHGPLPNGDAFVLSSRQDDFSDIGRALQNGDLTGARQGFVELAATVDYKLGPTGIGESGTTTQMSGDGTVSVNA